MGQRLKTYLTITLLTGCATSGTRPSDAPLVRIPPRVVGHHWTPSQGAVQIGMDSLHAAVLPAGSREIRIQLECSLCTPDHLFRIRTGPGRRVDGEAYLLRAHFRRRAGDSSAVDLDRKYQQRARAVREALQCSVPVRSADDRVDSCVVGRPIDWNGVLRAIEQSGILLTVSDTGYAPRPHGYTPSVLRYDATTGTDTFTPGSNPGCADQGGQSMAVELLDGNFYGTAKFWCLEVPGLSGTEHGRASALRSFLHSLVASEL